ncbi:MULTISPECIES: HypC/HybG/HupF family hydrogenase formation chaperone [Clostridium]|uniref:Hydrogenase maturation protein HypC n=1 Tax=Clostridium cadaveris TaxID=1529 RepID=A0A1I2JNI7_9CLOT|nr:HypC/HybG/HupF family hydrogenase formation chaperone [Clostridium cadaveris]MDU4953606.1 HypC/HybG/HupF family hydrogenase formation chaperone [Clostridium sp.]MDM8312691.1 HypC/HybG/HupF family hydrogenase formation chaperone [Clostridium cadaveris]MDY4948111.1 HypC/HybG/HupF family hydrogenase formation chaperone [Clostridium cadaveris]NME66157.1 HypC/HybG/HupF family hydrogenase formation chaperone [Clostridium cadaveris]NWK11113.1 HypC/HybG/HupF family hydrogenase formation chaperone [
MCIAVPLKVIKLFEEEAVVGYKGVSMRVNISLLEKVNIGDYVLVHAGCAIERLDREEGEKTKAIFDELFSEEDES